MTSEVDFAAPDGGFAAWASSARDALAERDDLVERLDVAVARTVRAATVVGVVGEFKQGKSALINSLLGVALCPVDDHVATSVVTVVSHANEPSVIVRRQDADGATVVEQVDPSRRHELISEPLDGTATDEDRATIERVDLRVPNPLLAEGLVLVDTPGVGGMRPAHAAATRRFLATADAVVFVTDATSELTETEVVFLREVAETCPHVLVALTKTDLFPQWRHIADLDRRHLDRAGVSAEVFPVSYPLRIDALRRGGDDRAVDGGSGDSPSESGYPELLDHLRTQVLPSARAGVRVRAVREITALLRQSAQSDRAELDALSHPDGGEAELAELRQARERLAGLSEGNARWRTVLNDAVTDLSQTVTFAFRDRVRSALDDLENAVDDIDGGDALDEAAEDMRNRIVEAVERSFDDIEEGVVEVTRKVADVLRLDELQIETFDPDEVSRAAVEAAWNDDGDDDRSISGDLFSALRGAQGGIIMLAVMGGLLPAAAAATIAAAPFMIGAGVLFGGKSIVDVRKQRRQRERQRVKVASRKAVDEVQFRVGNELGEALRAAQRHLRDELGTRIDELQRTTAETIGRLEHNAAADSSERERRRAAAADRLERIEVLTKAPPT